MKILTKVLAVLSMLLFFNSCLESDTVILVKKDGSGTITETVAIGAQAIAMMQMGAQQEGGEGADPFADFNENAMREKAATFGTGTEFVSVKKEEKDGKVIFTSLYKFPDVNQLTFSPESMTAGENAGAEEDAVSATFSLADGVLTVAMPDPSQNKPDFVEADENLDQMEMMAPMFAGMRMTAKLELEGGIKETNATYRDGETITLFGIDFDEMMKGEGGIKALSQVQGETREEVAKNLTEVQGIKMETKEKVTLAFE